MSKRRLASDINVVPYIDVMLVLLVIFMVTAPMLTQGMKVNLPKVNSAAIDTAKDEPLVVSIDAEGKLYLNTGKDEKQAKPLAQIQDHIRKVIKVKPATQVLVWGDTAVAYGKVVGLMAQLQQAGVQQVGLVTEPKG